MNTQKNNADRDGKLKAEGGLFGFFKSHIEPIKFFTAICAASIAFAEYRAKDYVDRVKTAAEVIDKFYASEEHKAILKLEDFRSSSTYTSKQNDLNSNKITSAQFREHVHSEVRRRHIGDLLKAVRGLKIVSICAIQGRCESRSICMQLAQQMQDLRCDFRESIKEMSTTGGSCIVDELSYFLDNHCREWMSSYLGVPAYASIKDNPCLYDKDTKESYLGDYCLGSIIYKSNWSFFDRFLN